MNALRSTLRDGWVIGIACAAALAYTTLKLIDEALAVLLSIVDGVPAELYQGVEEGELFAPIDFFNYVAVVNGHMVFFEPLIRAALLFAIAVPVAAVALHATRSPDDRTSGDP